MYWQCLSVDPFALDQCSCRMVRNSKLVSIHLINYMVGRGSSHFYLVRVNASKPGLILFPVSPPFGIKGKNQEEHCYQNENQG